MAFAPENLLSDMIEAVLSAVYIDMGEALKAYDALSRRFEIIDWVERAIRKEVQLRHPEEEVGGLAMNEKVRYQVWIERDNCIAGSI